jgi:glycylpeptide N-tetradecanoyltransferase
LTQADVPSAHALLSKYLLQLKLAPVFNLTAFEHWFLPRSDVISCYVATNDAQDPTKVTDLCSFYYLPSSVIGHTKYQTLYAAYSFYNIATSVELKDLLKDLLILAKRENQDVMNSLNVMDNEGTFKELEFRIGDEQLHYYLYGWICPTIEAGDVGLLLL